MNKGICALVGNWYKVRLNVLLIYNYSIRIANALPFCRVFHASPFYVSNCKIFPLILFTEYIKNTVSTEGLSVIRTNGPLLSANELSISAELFLFTNTWYCPLPYLTSNIEPVRVTEITERYFRLTVTWQSHYRLRIVIDTEILQTASTKPRTDNLRMGGKLIKKVGVVKSVSVWMYSETTRNTSPLYNCS
jgi:hypothetical protein